MTGERDPAPGGLNPKRGLAAPYERSVSERELLASKRGWLLAWSGGLGLGEIGTFQAPGKRRLKVVLETVF